MTEAAVSLDEVMARRFALVEEQAIIAGKHKAELAPLGEELALCELFIKDHMNQNGLQQAKTDAGMAFFTTKDSVTVQDMPAVISHIIDAAGAASVPDVEPAIVQRVFDHVKAHGMWGLLNNAVNKTATKERITAGVTPPGVEYSSYKDLSWRKGKAV